MTGNDWQRRAVKSLKRLLSRLFREPGCRFVIGRPRVQLSPSAPKFVGSSPILWYARIPSGSHVTVFLPLQGHDRHTFAQGCKVAARMVLGGLHHEYRWERI